MQDPVVIFNESARAELLTLRGEKKFTAEDFYPGAPSEALRADAEHQINALLDRLLSGLKPDSRKSFVMSEFQIALAKFEQSDTEERERFCGYLEQIMDATGIESSDGLLNSWLYGFDPAEL
ncbi:MAG: DUF4844 domain-containing protein [Pseudomonadota bacterium]